MSADVEQSETGAEFASVEHEGVILSGGQSEDALRDVIEARQAPESEPAAPVADAPASEGSTESSARTRDEGGRFAKPQQQTRGQKRFDQLTKERETEKTAREAAESRAADLEKRLAALEQQRGVTASQQVQPPAAQPEPPKTAPKFADFVAEVGTKYASYDDAVEAYTDARLAASTTDFDARIRTSIEADRASRAFQSHLDGLWDQGRKAYPDFDTVVGHSKVQVPDAVRHRIWTAPNAADLMYALAKDESLLNRIAAIQDPFELGMALSQVVSPKAVATPASTAPAVSNAPTPYQPVGSGSKTTAPTLGDLAASGGDDYDSSGYRERRRQERQTGRR